MYYKGLTSYRPYILFVLIAATIVLTLSALFTYRNSVNATEDFLGLQARGIAISIEASLYQSMINKQNILQKILSEGLQEGIAYISIYDKKGLILLHSNENLIGKTIQNEVIETVGKTGGAFYGYVTLGTGERVFILDMPVRAWRPDVVGEGFLHPDSGIKTTDMIMRLALHTYPAEKIIRQANIQISSMFVSVILLWITGYFFIRASRRSEELTRLMGERERLAIIGEMASVLAHEIRNPLGSIKGFAQYLREQGGMRSTDSEPLDIIISESRRLELLTEDLLLYAKPVELKVSEFDLWKTIDETVKTAEHLFIGKKDIKISVRMPEGLMIVSDRDKVKQILLNLIQNSVDAIEGAGNVEIKAELLNERFIINIKDTGTGMSPDIKEKAFKPFFTTKTKGTGLGLAIVDKLLQAIGGTIVVDSDAVKGTIFRVNLPMVLSGHK